MSLQWLGRRFKTVRENKTGSRLRFSELLSVYRVLDLFLLNFALFLYGEICIAINSNPLHNKGLLHLSFTLVWLVCAEVTRVYSFQQLLPTRAFYQALKTSVLAPVVFQGIPFVSPELPARRSELLILPALTGCLIVTFRFLFSHALSSKVLARAILIGSGQSNSLISGGVGQDGQGFEEAWPYQLYGFVGIPSDCPRSVPHLGGVDELAEIVDQHQPHELIISDEPGVVRGQYLRGVLRCMEMGVHVVSAQEILEVLNGKIQFCSTEGSLQDVLPVYRGAGHRVFVIVKRLVDLVVGCIGLVLTLLVAPFIYLLNLLANRGPLVYHQLRVGQGGKNFRIYKFRTMVPDAESGTGAVFCQPNDTRITSFGNFLRRTRLDELPQFWNILVGDMSIVGPRPERPEFVAQFCEEISLYSARHAVKPGLTGWAQVEFRYAASQEDTLEKLKYDLFYVKHQSIYMDYLVMLRTVRVVLGMAGR